jgi:hypothetical protein
MTPGITARTVILFGGPTILFWVATVVPFLLWFYSDGPESSARELYRQDIIPELRAVAPVYNLSPDKFSAELRRFFEIELAKSLVLAIIGVVSGALLIARRRAGRITAVSLCTFVFVLWLASIIRFAIHTSFSPMIFRLVTLPGGIHENVVNPIFLVLTVFFLTRKSVGRLLVQRVIRSPET